jgi:hypothetical protein
MQYLYMITLPVLFIGIIKFLYCLVYAAYHVFMHRILFKYLSYIFERKCIPHFLNPHGEPGRSILHLRLEILILIILHE